MVTIGAIQKEVASYFDVRLGDLNGRSRTQLIIQPRHIAMYLSRELTNASLKEIGQSFGRPGSRYGDPCLSSGGTRIWPPAGKRAESLSSFGTRSRARCSSSLGGVGIIPGAVGA